MTSKTKTVELEIPHVDIDGTRDAIIEIYDHAPYEDTLGYILAAAVKLCSSIESCREQWRKCDRWAAELSEAWDEAYAEFKGRLDEYIAAFQGAEDVGDLQAYILDPMFDGAYPTDMDLENVPTWPDIETPWRLMNDLVTIVFNAHRKIKRPQVAFNNMFVYFQASFVEFFESVSKDFEGQEMMMLRGGAAENAFDRARNRADQAIQDINDYISKKTQQAKYAAAGIALGVLGVGAIVFLAASRRKRKA